MGKKRRERGQVSLDDAQWLEARVVCTDIDRMEGALPPTDMAVFSVSLHFTISEWIGDDGKVDRVDSRVKAIDSDLIPSNVDLDCLFNLMQKALDRRLVLVPTLSMRGKGRRAGQFNKAERKAILNAFTEGRLGSRCWAGWNASEGDESEK